MILALGVALAGSVGAGLRWLADVALSRRRRTPFPWPILLVNATGCFVFATLIGVVPGGPVATIVGGGLLGGFTTYSTVSLDSAELWRTGRHALATLNALGTLALCAITALAGLLVGSALT